MTTQIYYRTVLRGGPGDAGRAETPEAELYPSEVVTLALLHAIKGGGTRAFYRWLTRDYLALFPQVPERTRLARLLRRTRRGPPDSGGTRRCWAWRTPTGSS